MRYEKFIKNGSKYNGMESKGSRKKRAFFSGPATKVLPTPSNYSRKRILKKKIKILLD